MTMLTGSLGSGMQFPVGTTTEVYKVIDTSGNEAQCSITLSVSDIEVPLISELSFMD